MVLSERRYRHLKFAKYYRRLYGCCKVWPSFLFVDDCFVKIWATCDNFMGKWFTAPSGKKIARTPMYLSYESSVDKGKKIG